MNWRRKLQVKDDRGHFGLASGVLAAFALTSAALLDGWHPRACAMLDFRSIGIIAFVVLAAFGVYLAWAVALRSLPFNPRKRVQGQYEKLKTSISKVSRCLMSGGNGVYYQVIQNAGTLSDDAAKRRITKFIERTQKILDWRILVDSSILIWFGESTCRSFMAEPEVSLVPPDWHRGDQWFINWNQIAVRLAWIRRWLIEQDNL